jgi:hypothetical protein
MSRLAVARVMKGQTRALHLLQITLCIRLLTLLSDLSYADLFDEIINNNSYGWIASGGLHVPRGIGVGHKLGNALLKEF